MKILVIGGEGRIASRLIPELNHGNKIDVRSTTRRTAKEYKYYLDLADQPRDYLGHYNVVIVCACDFRRGRSDKEQAKRQKTNVDGVIKAISRTTFNQLIFLSSYLSGSKTAYGKQKKAVEDWIIKNVPYYSILRIHPVKDEEDLSKLVEEIKCCVRGKLGIIEVDFK